MALEPGSNLGGRFAIVGVLGSGGTATVYLAVDQLRGDKVALKVVHSHLAADAKARRRLQREVRASTLLHHEAALVPWDLHELDGVVALSMPYHPGRTLRERVSAQGALTIPEATALGARVAGALATAHRSGLLHLDVTPNNVLVDGGQAPVLTDFGLSRAQSEATRSTSVMGTAGFMAPERLGERARPTPSADLYGLGCVLYFAVTGQPPFPTDNPMAALQAQLAGSFTPVRELRPDCPENLASTIQALLAKDPSDRPASAAMVRDALEHGHGLETPKPRTISRNAHLEPGHWAVVVRERGEDSARRKQLRIDAKKMPNSLEAVVSKRAREMMQGVLTYVGLKTGEQAPPERLLVNAIAHEAEVDPNKLSESLVLLQSEFVLADRVSADAAKRIASDARSAGFHTEVLAHPDPDARDLTRFLAPLVPIGWVAFGLSWVTPYRVFSFYFLFVMIALSILINHFKPDTRGQKLDKLPVAYTNRLTRWLAEPIRGRFSLDEVDAGSAPAEVEQVTAQTRGQALLERVQGEIDALLASVDSLELNVVAAADLRTTARALQDRAEELAAQVDRLEVELATEPEDTSWMEPRLDRLRTKARAGEAVDASELANLEKSLQSAREAETLRERIESRHTAAIAGLLEIGTAATTARRNLLASPEQHTTTQAVENLARQAALAEQARRELNLA